jgi:hypothetical protein
VSSSRPSRLVAAVAQSVAPLAAVPIGSIVGGEPWAGVLLAVASTAALSALITYRSHPSPSLPVGFRVHFVECVGLYALFLLGSLMWVTGDNHGAGLYTLLFTAAPISTNALIIARFGKGRAQATIGGRKLEGWRRRNIGDERLQLALPTDAVREGVRRLLQAMGKPMQASEEGLSGGQSATLPVLGESQRSALITIWVEGPELGPSVVRVRGVAVEGFIRKRREGEAVARQVAGALRRLAPPA